MMYRASGRRLSFLEARHLPKTLVDVFFELDSLLDKAERQYLKKKQAQETPAGTKPHAVNL